MGKGARARRLRRGQTPPPRGRVASPSPDAERALDRPAAATRVPWSSFWIDHARAAVTLFALALVVRASLLLEISRTPFFLVRNIDSEAYHEWAVRIAAGQWMPTGAFYQSPFYAYYLALSSALFGVGSWGPRIPQVVLGSLSPVLIYAIGTRLFSPRVGWIAGVGLALYGPIILEEITFSKTTLLVVTSLAGFALYLWEAPRGRTVGMLAAGALFGVSVVGVGQWLLPFVALVAWVPMMADRLTPAARRRATVAFAVGGLAIILPLVAWNSLKGGGLILTSGDAGLNFYNGNNERASGLPAKPMWLRDVPQYEEGDARVLAERAVGHRLTPAEVSRYWSGQALTWIARHPGDWLVLLGKKLLTVAPDYAHAYIALGRCADAERVLTKVDRARGLAGPSGETRALLDACSARR